MYVLAAILPWLHHHGFFAVCLLLGLLLALLSLARALRAPGAASGGLAVCVCGARCASDLLLNFKKKNLIKKKKPSLYC